MSTTFSIETLVEAMLLARVQHSATFTTANTFIRDTETNLSSKAGPLLIISAFDEGAEVFRSGIRRCRVEFEVRANIGPPAAPTIDAAAFQTFYDEALSYLDDAAAETEMTAASPGLAIKVIGVIRSGHGTDRPLPEESSLVRSRTITRTLLVANIT